MRDRTICRQDAGSTLDHSNYLVPLRSEFCGASVFKSVQIQPMNVATKTGYAKNGIGRDVGKI